MSELKPCPFCGEEPEVFDFNDGRFIVECANPDCDVYPYTSIHYDKEDAIAAWNQRATVYTKPTTLSQLQAENAKLRELAGELWTYAEQELLCDENCPYGDTCDWMEPTVVCVFKRRMRELGVEVDG